MSKAWGSGSTGKWRKLRAYVLARDPQCTLRLAGCTGVSTHADHKLAKSKGGSDSPENLQGSCRNCNLKKGAGGSAQPAPIPLKRWW